MPKHQQQQQGPYVCDHSTCGKSYTYFNSFHKHVKSHSSKPTPRAPKPPALDLARLCPADFAAAEKSPAGAFKVSDCIARFKRCGRKNAEKIARNIAKSKPGQMHAFKGRNGQLGSPVLVAAWPQLLSILETVPGPEANKLRKLRMLRKKKPLMQQKIMLPTAPPQNPVLGDMKATSPSRNPGLASTDLSQFEACRTTLDGRISVIDAVAKVCECSPNYAAEKLRNSDVGAVFSHLEKYQFPGARQRPTPVATPSELMSIISLLPGEKARALRAQQAEIAIRARAGDRHLDERKMTNTSLTVISDEKGVPVPHAPSQNPVLACPAVSIDLSKYKECRTTPDGRIAVIDAVAKVCECSPKYAAEKLRNSEVAEIIGNLEHYQFPGRGQRPTPVATPNDLMSIISRLPGEQARALRAQQAEVTRRVSAGPAMLDRKDPTGLAGYGPVLNLNISQVSETDFKHCRRTPNGKFALSDCIRTFKGCSAKTATKLVLRWSHGRQTVSHDSVEFPDDNRSHGAEIPHHDSGQFPECKRQFEVHQFQRPNGSYGPPIAVVDFKQLLSVLVTLSGPEADILRQECQEITQRHVSGDRHLEERTMMDTSLTVISDGKNMPTPHAPSQNPVLACQAVSIDLSKYKECRTTPDGRIAVIDAVAKVCKCSADYASQKLRNSEVSEIITNLEKYQFPGRGQRPTPVATPNDLMSIISRLPGEQARALRAQQAEVTRRVSAGDESVARATLHHYREIKSMTPSHNPVLALDVMNVNSRYFEGLRIMSDGRISVIDVVAKVFECSPNYASEKLRNSEVHEILVNLGKYQFPGNGQRLTPVATLTDIMRIISALPGNQADALRAQQVEITIRARAGDRHLEDAVRHNRATESNAFKRQLSSGLQNVSVESEDQAPFKRRRTTAMDLTGMGMGAVNVQGAGISVELLQQLIGVKILQEQTKQKQEETKQKQEETKQKQAVEETKQTKLKEETKQAEEETKQAEEETKQTKLKEETKQKLEETKQTKLREETKQQQIALDHQGKLNRKYKKTKTSPFSKAMLKRAWEAEFKSFTESCACGRAMTPLSVRVLLRTDSPNLQQLLAPANVSLICRPCAASTPEALTRQPHLRKQRALTWLRCNGPVYAASCYCCRQAGLRFLGPWHSGHVRSRAQEGSDDLRNRRPVCAGCNQDMGTQNMEAFMRTHRFTDVPHPGDDPYTQADTGAMFADLLKGGKGGHCGRSGQTKNLDSFLFTPR